MTHSGYISASPSVNEAEWGDNLIPYPLHVMHSLLQHVKCAAYQDGHIWGEVLEPDSCLPSPQEWGWSMEGNWRPFWTTLPVMQTADKMWLSEGV